MPYHVQADIVTGVTHHVGWFECQDLLSHKFFGEIRDIWPNTILMDKKGVDGADIRSIADDDIARGFRAKLAVLK